MLQHFTTNGGARHLRGRIPAPEWRTIHESVTTNIGPRGVYTYTYTRTRLVRDHYWFEVVNVRTGDVIYRSDAFGFEEAVNDCRVAVGVARGAWFMSLRGKDLK